jgi:hypothetical protein
MCVGGRGLESVLMLNLVVLHSALNGNFNLPGGWVGARAGPEVLGKGEISFHNRDSDRGPSSLYLSNYVIPAC